jgi:hypothetical protein
MEVHAMRGRKRTIQVGGPFTNSYISRWQKRVLQQKRIPEGEKNAPYIPLEAADLAPPSRRGKKNRQKAAKVRRRRKRRR